jgi:predicted PurR-regulated permease PerM
VIFVGAGIVVVGFIGLMVPLTVDQTLRLVERIPSYLDSLAEFLARFDIEFDVDQVGAALTSVDSSLESVSRDVLGSVFGVGSRLLSTFLELLTIGLFTFYITADAPRLRRTLLSVLTPERQREVLHVVEIAIEKTGGYFYSRALLAGLASLVTWLVLTLLDVPFALPLGIWVGVISQFIPVIGTYLGGILPVLIALLEDPWDALWVIVFILVYQQIENYLIAPRVTARTMALHPAVAFGSAIVGGTMMGVAGAVMALPVAATIQAYISTYLHRHELIESHLFDEPVTTASGLVKPPRVDGDA